MFMDTHAGVNMKREVGQSLGQREYSKEERWTGPPAVQPQHAAGEKSSVHRPGLMYIGLFGMAKETRHSTMYPQPDLTNAIAFSYVSPTDAIGDRCPVFQIRMASERRPGYTLEHRLSMPCVV